jgi:hypothetical protein
MNSMEDGRRNPGSRPWTFKTRENPGSRPSTFADCEYQHWIFSYSGSSHESLAAFHNYPVETYHKSTSDVPTSTGTGSSEPCIWAAGTTPFAPALTCI